jgi:hypothetical protein
MWPAETALFNMGLNHAQCDTLTLRYNEQAWGQKNSKDTSILSTITTITISLSLLLL